MLLGIQFENPNQIDVTDPSSDEFYNYFRGIAKKNMLIYEEVFSTLPTDRVRRFDQVSQYTEAPKLKETDPIQVDFNEFFSFIRFVSFSLGSRKIKRNSRSRR